MNLAPNRISHTGAIQWVESLPCPAGCSGGTIVRHAWDRGHGEIEYDLEQCQFCAERDQVLEVLRSIPVEPEKCQHRAWGTPCGEPKGHDGPHLFRCSGLYCPGLTWPASAHAHPYQCVTGPGDDSPRHEDAPATR